MNWSVPHDFGFIPGLNSINRNVSIWITIFWCLEKSQAPSSPWAGGPLLTSASISHTLQGFPDGYNESYPHYINSIKEKYPSPRKSL